MGIEVSSQPQIFKNSSVVIGVSGGAAVEGLTVYGDVSASGWLWGSNGTFVKTVAAGNGGTTYELQFYPTLRPEDYIVSVDGVVQAPGDAYTITRTEPAPANIVFASGIPTGAKIVVIALRNLATNTKSTATFKKNLFTTVAGQEAYNLTHYTNASSENYLVFLDGVMQRPDSDYTIEYGGASAVVVVPGVSAGIQLVVLSLFNTDGTHATTSAGLTVQNGGGLESTIKRLNFVSGLTGTTDSTGTCSISGYTPPTTPAAAGIVRAWVNFDGSRNSSGGIDALNTNRFIRSSSNVSSVQRTGAGLYTINFTTALPSTSYIVLGTTAGLPGTNNNTGVVGVATTLGDYTLKNTNSVGIMTVDNGGDVTVSWNINEVAIIG